MPCGEADDPAGRADTVGFCCAFSAMLTFRPVAGAMPAAIAAFWPKEEERPREAGAGATGRGETGALALAVPFVAVPFVAAAGVGFGVAAGVLRCAVAVRLEASLAAGMGAAFSAECGGASRSSSRAEGGGVVAGWTPDFLALRERRLILGTSEAGLSKLNSIGSAEDSERAAGEGFSGVTRPQITAPDDNSKT